jgi:hypothetical protein
LFFVLAIVIKINDVIIIIKNFMCAGITYAKTFHKPYIVFCIHRFSPL